jgi:hypothetical protein
MPSRPMRHAGRKIAAPSSSVCVLGPMPIRRLPNEPRQPLLAVTQGHGAEVLAIKFEEIEAVQHGLADGAVAMQGIEDTHAVRAADAGFAVQDERAGAQLHCGGRDRRIAGGPIVAAAGEEPHDVAVAGTCRR